MKKNTNKKKKVAIRSARTAKLDSVALGEKLSPVEGEQHWPTLFRPLFRPERFKYIKGETKTLECVFCASSEAGISAQSLLVYKSRRVMVILNKYPYNSGHLLVLPVRHCADLEDMSEQSFLELQVVLRHAVRILKAAYKPQGINIGLNLGQAAGAGLPGHLHYHIIPRWSGDLNFFPLVAHSKTLIQTLEETFAQLQPYFQRIDKIK